jgi:hypothetical protein
MDAAFLQGEAREFRIGGVIFQHENADFLLHSAWLFSR